MGADERLSPFRSSFCSAGGDAPERAHGFVRKPFAFETLVARIRGALGETGDGAHAAN